jgi:hypothetical protein
MSGRHFDRRFNEVASEEAKRIDIEYKEESKRPAAGGGAQDAVQEVLQAWKDKDYFKCAALGLR